MNVELLALIGGALTAMLIAVALREVQREYAVLLSLCCAAALMIWAVGTIRPVVEQIGTLVESTGLDPQYSGILLKALGIALCTQLACDACKDAGESAIGDKIEFCGRAALAALSLPLFLEILSLAQKIFAV